MPKLTFDEIDRIAADHARRESERNAPKCVAIRAVYELSSLLTDLPSADRCAVLHLIHDEITTYFG